MENMIEQVIADLTRARDGITKDLAATPDDKLNWSPASTARTPLQLVAHVAMSVSGMQEAFSGHPLEERDLSKLDAKWREDEKAYTTREEVQNLLDTNCENYVAFLKGLTSEQVGSMVHLSFGDMPMAVVIHWPGRHIQMHGAQLQYLQTIYGDMTWHM